MASCTAAVRSRGVCCVHLPRGRGVWWDRVRLRRRPSWISGPFLSPTPGVPKQIFFLCAESFFQENLTRNFNTHVKQIKAEPAQLKGLRRTRGLGASELHLFLFAGGFGGYLGDPGVLQSNL